MLLLEYTILFSLTDWRGGSSISYLTHLAPLPSTVRVTLLSKDREFSPFQRITLPSQCFKKKSLENAVLEDSYIL